LLDALELTMLIARKDPASREKHRSQGRASRATRFGTFRKKMKGR
jgi:hypothetical protein